MTVCLSLFIPIPRLTSLSPLAIAGGLYFLFLGFHLLARKRRLLSTPTSLINEAAKGAVEISGEAAGPYTLSAPISGKPCFLYRTTIWQQQKNKNGGWERIVDETLHLPFFVADPTGQMLIEPLGADLDLPDDFHADSRGDYDYDYDYDAAFASPSSGSAAADELPPRVGVFLSRHNVVPVGRLRVAELSIKPEDALFVSGTLADNPGVQVRPLRPHDDARAKILASKNRDEAPDPNTPSPPLTAPEVIQLSTRPVASSTREMSQQAKIAAALYRAGITKPEAWSTAGVPYENVAVADAAPSGPGRGETPTMLSGFDLNPALVLMNGDSDSTFTISFRSQKESVGGLAWRSTALIWGGVTIVLLGVYTLLQRINLS